MITSESLKLETSYAQKTSQAVEVSKAQETIESFQTHLSVYSEVSQDERATLLTLRKIIEESELLLEYVPDFSYYTNDIMYPCLSLNGKGFGFDTFWHTFPFSTFQGKYFLLPIPGTTKEMLMLLNPTLLKHFPAIAKDLLLLLNHKGAYQNFNQLIQILAGFSSTKHNAFPDILNTWTETEIEDCLVAFILSGIRQEGYEDISSLNQIFECEKIQEKTLIKKMTEVLMILAKCKLEQSIHNLLQCYQKQFGILGIMNLIKDQTNEFYKLCGGLLLFYSIKEIDGKSNTELLIYLLDVQRLSPNVFIGPERDSLLLRIAMQSLYIIQAEAIIQLLLKNDVDVNYQNAKGETALIIFAQRRWPSAFEIILNANANPLLESLDGKNALAYFLRAHVDSEAIFLRAHADSDRHDKKMITFKRIFWKLLEVGAGCIESYKRFVFEVNKLNILEELKLLDECRELSKVFSVDYCNAEIVVIARKDPDNIELLTKFDDLVSVVNGSHPRKLRLEHFDAMRNNILSASSCVPSKIKSCFLQSFDERKALGEQIQVHLASSNLVDLVTDYLFVNNVSNGTIARANERLQEQIQKQQQMQTEEQTCGQTHTQNIILCEVPSRVKTPAPFFRPSMSRQDLIQEQLKVHKWQQANACRMLNEHWHKEPKSKFEQLLQLDDTEPQNMAMMQELIDNGFTTRINIRRLYKDSILINLISARKRNYLELLLRGGTNVYEDEETRVNTNGASALDTALFNGDMTAANLLVDAGVLVENRAGRDLTEKVNKLLFEHARDGKCEAEFATLLRLKNIPMPLIYWDHRPIDNLKILLKKDEYDKIYQAILRELIRLEKHNGISLFYEFLPAIVNSNRPKFLEITLSELEASERVHAKLKYLLPSTLNSGDIASADLLITTCPSILRDHYYNYSLKKEQTPLELAQDGKCEQEFMLKFCDKWIFLAFVDPKGTQYVPEFIFSGNDDSSWTAFQQFAILGCLFDQEYFERLVKENRIKHLDILIACIKKSPLPVYRDKLSMKINSEEEFVKIKSGYLQYCQSAALREALKLGKMDFVEFLINAETLHKYEDEARLYDSLLNLAKKGNCEKQFKNLLLGRNIKIPFRTEELPAEFNSLLEKNDSVQESQVIFQQLIDSGLLRTVFIQKPYPSSHQSTHYDLIKLLSERGKTKYLELVLKAGVNIDALQTPYLSQHFYEPSCTALRSALRTGNIQAVEVLLDAGASLIVPPCFYDEILDDERKGLSETEFLALLARKSIRFPLVREDVSLLENFKYILTRNDTMKIHQSAFQELIRSGLLSEKIEKSCVLFEIIKRRKSCFLALILKMQINVNVIIDGTHALGYALLEGDMLSVEMLMAAGFDLKNAHCNSTRPILAMAVLGNCKEAFLNLLRKEKKNSDLIVEMRKQLRYTLQSTSTVQRNPVISKPAIRRSTVSSGNSLIMKLNEKVLTLEFKEKAVAPIVKAIEKQDQKSEKEYKKISTKIRPVKEKTKVSVLHRMGASSSVGARRVIGGVESEKMNARSSTASARPKTTIARSGRTNTKPGLLGTSPTLAGARQQGTKTARPNTTNSRPGTASTGARLSNTRLISASAMQKRTIFTEQRTTAARPVTASTRPGLPGTNSVLAAAKRPGIVSARPKTTNTRPGTTSTVSELPGTRPVLARVIRWGSANTRTVTNAKPLAGSISATVHSKMPRIPKLPAFGLHKAKGQQQKLHTPKENPSKSPLIH